MARLVFTRLFDSVRTERMGFYTHFRSRSVLKRPFPPVSAQLYSLPKRLVVPRYICDLVSFGPRLLVHDL